MTLLEVRKLRVVFDTDLGRLAAVDELSFKLERGETLGLLGESGSGKTVTALSMLGMPPRGAVVETGEVVLDGRNLLALSPREWESVRGNEVVMIFQDPRGALNPLMTVGQQLAETLRKHRGANRREARSESARALGEVGFGAPEERLDSYPHELSGGMCQRVLIASALLARPKLLIADEPTTALDVTIQAQILDLLDGLQRDHGTAILLITHDLGLIAGTCDHVHVVYAGRTVETARADELFDLCLHPYTLGLLRSAPRLDGPVSKSLLAIPGHPPELAELPEGCAFAPRCELATVNCQGNRPLLTLWQDPKSPLPSVSGRRVACFELEQMIAAQLGNRAPEGASE